MTKNDNHSNEITLQELIDCILKLHSRYTHFHLAYDPNRKGINKLNAKKGNESLYEPLSM